MNKKLKKFLHTFFKIFIIFLLGTAAINIIIFAAVYFNHTSKLSKEEGYLVPPGQMVEVDGHDMHVWVTGNEDAKDVLVFLHESKITDDSIALQPLFKELDEYKIVYVDRSGFGFSEVSGQPRDIDTVLEETRLAIKGAGVEGPYNIVALGTSGVEAIHWANTYKDEVVSIIGIDMYYPEQFANTTTEKYCGFFDYMMVPFYKLGGQRFIKELYPVNTYGVYNDVQMTIRKALISKNGYTKDMYEEDLAMVDNAGKVAQEGLPDTEMFLIYANPFLEPYVTIDDTVNAKYVEQSEANPDVDLVAEYNRWLREYFDEYENIAVEEMSGPGRLYTYNPEELASIIEDYLE